jgi:RNA methyltransferase, TrmH family
MLEKITSVNNQKIKDTIKLREARQRKKQDLIIIEGRAEIAMAIEFGVEIVNLFFCCGLAKQNSLDQITFDKTIEVAESVFNKMAVREHPDGYLATARVKEKKLSDLKLKKNSLVIVLEDVEKPGNLGAIMRTGDAAGVDAILICDPQTDIYNPNAIRASLGTVFSNRTVKCQSSEAISWLKKNKIKMIAATPEAKKSYFKVDYKRSSVIIIGTEHEGLSQIWLDSADEKVKIPMNGKIDSLNASVSTAIIVFEALRQREK